MGTDRDWRELPSSIVKALENWWPGGMKAFPGGPDQIKAFFATWDIGKAEIRTPTGSPAALDAAVPAGISTFSGTAEEKAAFERWWKCEREPSYIFGITPAQLEKLHINCRAGWMARAALAGSAPAPNNTPGDKV